MKMQTISMHWQNTSMQILEDKHVIIVQAKQCKHLVVSHSERNVINGQSVIG